LIFPIAKPILATQTEPLIVAAMTYMIAGFSLFPVSFISEKKIKQKTVLKGKDYYILLTIGILGGGIAPLLFFEGLKNTSASNASVLEGGELLFTAVIALTFFKEKLTKLGYFGMIMTIIGITLVSFYNANGQNFLYNFNLSIGNILIILSTLCWGFDNNLSKIISHRISNTSKIVYIKSLIGGILLLSAAVLFRYKFAFDIAQIPYYLILGIGGFGLSLFFFIESLRIIGTLKAIVIFSSSSIFGLIFSFVILNEKIGIMQWISTAMVIFGLYYVNKDEIDYIKKVSSK
jgi:drug/metabolite transporter (DMT)-like permease